MGSPGGMVYAGQKNRPDQATRRASPVVLDQHGRRVGLVWDMEARGVVGITLDFIAPWIPHIKFLRTHAEYGFPQSVEWEYDKMVEENRSGWAMYYENLLRYAGRMPGVNGTEAYEAALERRWDDVPKALLKECGITPEPEEFIKAAMAGNKWILGFSTIVPEWAGPINRLLEMQKSKIGQAVTEDDLARFRDEPDGADLDEEFDPDAKGGKREVVRPEKTENSRHTKTTRREVRLSGSLEE